MMEAILSNDEEDWHSHLERGVKESEFDSRGGFFVIGNPRAGARGNPEPRLVKPASRLARRTFRRIAMPGGDPRAAAFWPGSDRIERCRKWRISISVHAGMYVFIPIFAAISGQLPQTNISPSRAGLAAR
ncbi:hypothetical protein [Burkholderia diffusa]|uniref:hypothetical protein n=1 Tax=Burkholderia diffusa TaxID=488732 RepID=UPI0012D8A3D5|nr:hypothetical protein [Burkholderia diffusa]